MIYRGRVENGIVILQDDIRLPDGTEVNVEPVEASESVEAAELPTLY